MFHRLKTIWTSHAASDPSGPIGWSSRGTKLKRKKKVWNPSTKLRHSHGTLRKMMIFGDRESPFGQNLNFELKLFSKLHRCILGRFPGEKSNRWTCHWKVDTMDWLLFVPFLSITSAAIRCELSMQRKAAAVFFVLRNWRNQRSNCKIGATSSCQNKDLQSLHPENPLVFIRKKSLKHPPLAPPKEPTLRNQFSALKIRLYLTNWAPWGDIGSPIPNGRKYMGLPGV